MRKIEQHRLRLDDVLSKKDKILHARFITLLDTAKTELYPFQTRESATNQGELHVRNILYNLSDLIPPSSLKLMSGIELFVLMAAAALHDVAKIRQVNKHEELGRDIIVENYSQLVLTERIAIYVGHLIIGHGNIDLYTLPESRVYSTKGEIRIRYLASLLRIADELEMDFTRAESLTRNIKQMANNRIWRVRDAFDGILIKSSEWSIEAHASPIDMSQETLVKDAYQYLLNRFDTVRKIFHSNGLFYNGITLVCNNDRKKSINAINSSIDLYYSDEQATFSLAIQKTSEILEIASNTIDNYYPLAGRIYELNWIISKSIILVNDVVVEALEYLLRDTPLSPIIVFGPLGSGKTTVFEVFTSHLLLKYQNDPPNNRIPIFVRGSELAFTENWESTIIDRYFKCESPDDRHSIIALINKRGIILIDAIDEMKNLPSTLFDSIKTKIEQIRSKGIPVMINCRGNFFDEETQRRCSSFAIVITLEGFDRKRIYSILQRLRPKDATEVFKSLEQTYDMIELASRPIFLKMIIETIDRIRIGGGTKFELYEEYITKSLSKRFTDSKELQTVINALEEIAWKQLHSPSIATGKAEKLIFNGIIASDGMVESEFIAHGLIEKNNIGWRFSHRSFAEYFIARRIRKNWGTPNCITEISEGTRQFLHEMLRNFNPPPLVNRKNELNITIIEPGYFIFGSQQQNESRPLGVKPNAKYSITTTPVTNSQFLQFLTETHYTPKEYRYFLAHLNKYSDKILPNDISSAPVVYINWFDATAYADWCNGQLPTEEEWERAGRGIDGRVYPWGDMYENNASNTSEFNAHRPTIVDNFERWDSPTKCMDMSGNVWEWLFDNDPNNELSDAILVKGGSWMGGRGSARLSNRKGISPYTRDNITGFRVIINP